MGTARDLGPDPVARGHERALVNRDSLFSTKPLFLLSRLNEQLDLVRAGAARATVNSIASGGNCSSASESNCSLDRDTHLLELSSLAAWGTEFTVGASVVTGIGVVSGVEVVVAAHDPTVRGGT
jgi:acyl-CoA carboxylase subunit beta